MNTCDTCKAWDRATIEDPSPDEEATAVCRRHSPGFDSRTGNAIWPRTGEYDHCFDYIAIEGK